MAAPVTASRRLASRLVPAYVHPDGERSGGAGGTGPGGAGPGGAGPGGAGGAGGGGAEPGLAAAVLRYRIMAYVVGTGLLVLVFVGVPLQYGAGIPQVDAIVGPIHGFLYIVYLLTAVDLARRARFTLLQLAAMIGAGFLPFLAFVIEHRVMQRMQLMPAPGGDPGAGTPGAGGGSHS